MLYLWNTDLKKKVHSMVLIDSVHIMVVWRRSVQLTRANYLIMHSTTVFWVVIYPPRSNLFVVIRVGPPP